MFNDNTLTDLTGWKLYCRTPTKMDLIHETLEIRVECDYKPSEPQYTVYLDIYDIKRIDKRFERIQQAYGSLELNDVINYCTGDAFEGKFEDVEQ